MRAWAVGDRVLAGFTPGYIVRIDGKDALVQAENEGGRLPYRVPLSQLRLATTDSPAAKMPENMPVRTCGCGARVIDAAGRTLDAEAHLLGGTGGEL